MPVWSEMRGWAKHRTFGLRKEWLAAFLDYYPDWRDKVSLGNRQVEAMQVWAKTAGLEKKEGTLSPLGELFRREGINNLFFWQLLWVKVVFSFPTARWYVHLGTGSWDYSVLRRQMQNDVPHLKERTVYDALVELVGLFRYTPIGAEIRQGEIREKPGSSNRYYVERKGIVPDEKALIMAMMHLFAEKKATSLNIGDNLTWPWVVFGCDRETVLLKILSSNHDLFALSNDSKKILWQAKGEEKEKWLSGDILII